MAAGSAERVCQHRFIVDACGLIMKQRRGFTGWMNESAAHATASTAGTDSRLV